MTSSSSMTTLRTLFILLALTHPAKWVVSSSFFHTFTTRTTVPSSTSSLSSRRYHGHSSSSSMFQMSSINNFNSNQSPPTVLIAGATGYIGRAVVRESVLRGYHTIALIRPSSTTHPFPAEFQNATVLPCDVENPSALQQLFQQQENIDTIVSCLAARSGIEKEAYAIDYRATLNCLEAGRMAGARHFVLLSAFCVRKPLLQLQQAKLKFEAALQSQSDLTYSIVRPTAYFKSVSGQLEGIQQGAPYVLFGNGEVTRCNPIGQSDLATYLLDCMYDEERWNVILNVGGPDMPLTNRMLGEMMFRSIDKPPKFVYAPTGIFDVIIDTLSFLANVTNYEPLQDAAEYAKIGKYYAVEDMLTTAPEERFGKVSMQDHYDTIASEGQDPFTPVRATAFISRAIEMAPAAFAVTIPLLAYAAVSSSSS